MQYKRTYISIYTCFTIQVGLQWYWIYYAYDCV